VPPCSAASPPPLPHHAHVLDWAFDRPDLCAPAAIAEWSNHAPQLAITPSSPHLPDAFAKSSAVVESHMADSAIRAGDGLVTIAQYERLRSALTALPTDAHRRAVSRRLILSGFAVCTAARENASHCVDSVEAASGTSDSSVSLSSPLLIPITASFVDACRAELGGVTVTELLAHMTSAALLAPFRRTTAVLLAPLTGALPIVEAAYRLTGRLGAETSGTGGTAGTIGPARARSQTSATFHSGTDTASSQANATCTNETVSMSFPTRDNDLSSAAGDVEPSQTGARTHTESGRVAFVAFAQLLALHNLDARGRSANLFLNQVWVGSDEGITIQHLNIFSRLLTAYFSRPNVISSDIGIMLSSMWTPTRRPPLRF
jgi:hypothetical protein